MRSCWPCRPRPRHGEAPPEAATRAIAGLDQAGQYAAIVDAAGGIVAASPGFDSLGIEADTLAALVAEAGSERLVKRMIAAAAATLPAGFVRLTTIRPRICWR